MANLNDVPIGFIVVFLTVAVIAGCLLLMSIHLKNLALVRWLDAVIELCEAVPNSVVGVAPQQDRLMTLIECVKGIETPDLSPGSTLITSKMIGANVPSQYAAALPVFKQVWDGVWLFYCSGGLDAGTLVATCPAAHVLHAQLTQLRTSMEK